MIRHARMRGHRALFLPGLDHASIAAQFVLDGILAKEGESRGSRSAASATSSGCARSSPRPATGDARAAAAGRGVGRLGPPALHDGRGLGQGRPGRVRRASTATDLAYRTEALVNWCPGCRTSVSDLEVVAHAGDRDALVGPLPPHRPGDGRAAPDETITDRHDPTRDDPRRHGGRGPPRRRALRRRSSGGSVRIPFVDRDVPIIADDVVDPAFGTGAVKITPGPRPRRLRDRPAPRPAGIDVLADDATHHRDRRRATTASTGTRRARRSSPTSRPRGDLVGRRAARDGHRALPAQQRRHRAAAQDPVVHPDDAARGNGRSRRPAAAGRGSCPSDSRRPGSTG